MCGARAPFRCRFSVRIVRACWLLVIAVPKPVVHGLVFLVAGTHHEQLSISLYKKTPSCYGCI